MSAVYKKALGTWTGDQPSNVLHGRPLPRARAGSNRTGVAGVSVHHVVFIHFFASEKTFLFITTITLMAKKNKEPHGHSLLNLSKHLYNSHQDMLSSLELNGCSCRRCEDHTIADSIRYWLKLSAFHEPAVPHGKNLKVPRNVDSEN